MSRNGKAWKTILASLGFLVLIFDSNLALEGAASGVELCIKTVIPALFPFFVLSTLLSSSLDAGASGTMQRIAQFFSIPPSASSLLVPSVLGGYPVGAKCVGDLYRRRQISREDAVRLLTFCSNAGPSFLLGMVSGYFPERKMVWMLWAVHLLSAALTALTVSTKVSHRTGMLSSEWPQKTDVIPSAAKAMCQVCCWVILFRILICFLKAWFLWRFPVWLQVLWMGLLELTNGCCQLLLIPDVRIRFVLCSCLLGFGGICVLLQTVSVTEGLPIGSYVKGKCLQTMFSFLLSSSIMAEHGFYFAGFVPVFVILFRNLQKRSRNFRAIPV